MWQITEMPAQHGRGRDYIGWLRHQDRNLHVKVHIGGHVNEEEARIILQQFAGIITLEGASQALIPKEDR